MSDDLVKRIMHRSHPLHIEAAKRIQSQAARIERLEVALREIKDHKPRYDYVEVGVVNEEAFSRPGSPYDRGREFEARLLSEKAARALAKLNKEEGK